MDPPNSTTNHPFARPLSQPNGHDTLRAAIPPPPYTLQAPVQRQPSLGNDPFLPRRQEQAGPGQDMDKAFRHGPFGVAKYATSLPRDALGVATENYNRAQENDGGWRFGDGRIDRFRPHTSGGSSNSTPLPPPPPPPPPPSSSFGGPFHDPSPQRDSVRLQEHRTSSPRMYGATQEVPPPPPPPPPFSNHPMLPPSPSYNARAVSQIPPPPPPFSGARELPAPSSTSRLGSSMSILSMLDSGPAKCSREPSTAAPMNGTSPTCSYPPSAQHIPPASSPTRSSHSNGFLHRSPPDKHHVSQGHTNRPFRAYSGGTPHRPRANIKAGSPDGFRNGPLSATSLSQYSPRADTAAQQDWKQEHNKGPSVGRVIERPNSQPNSYSLQLEVIERSNRERLQQARREQLALQEENATRDANSRRASRNGVSSFDFLPREAQLERQRHLERQAQLDRQQRMEQEQQAGAQRSPRDDRLCGMDYPFLTQSSVFSEPAVSINSPEKLTFATRFNRDAQTPLSIIKGPYSDETLRRLREEHQNSSHRISNYSLSAPRSRFLDSVDERQTQSYPQNAMSGPMERTRSVDGVIQQHRNAEEGIQTHRTMLGMMLENNRRAGRISPLPQAVQGAQGQTRGPSSDPSIKNEFSRMFAGIGSGVGSAGMNSGTSTPFKPPSPVQNTDNDHRTPFGTRIEMIALSKSQNVSRTGKRRKLKNEDSKDLEIIEDRSIGPSGSRAVKRKHGYQHHDHRLHHHRLNENGTSSRTTSHSTNPADHRHHHHPHHEIDSAGHVIHHHNHSKAKPAPPIPTIVINNKAIVSSINTLTRRHLGSVLYAPRLKPPDSEHPRTISHYVIPRCDGKVNCTLTVRIPRFYLSKEEREQVCRTRYVYGTDIYADDSDPLGAAIHAGWVCGDWGDDSVLETLGVSVNQKEGKDQETQMTLSSPPATPMLPPAGKDLHVTLLLLPTLQKYAEKRSHGFKSREWGSDHDGMSYQIERIQWVDEGAGRGEERTAAARRKRFKTAMGPKEAGPALSLGMGKSLGKSLESVRVGTVAA